MDVSTTSAASGLYGGGFMMNSTSDHRQQKDEEEEYLSAIPPTSRFRPNDKELVYYYLKNKIENKKLPPNKIKDVELYKFNPEDLTRSFPPCCDHPKEWYFFTPRNRKYKRGKRPDRSAGNGSWKATGADEEVKRRGELIGFRKVLVFYCAKYPTGAKTNWIMHEYRLKDAPPSSTNTSSNMKLDDWVLCKVYYNCSKSSIKQAEGKSRDNYQAQQLEGEGRADNENNLLQQQISVHDQGRPAYSLSSNFNDTPMPIPTVNSIANSMITSSNHDQMGYLQHKRLRREFEYGHQSYPVVNASVPSYPANNLQDFHQFPGSESYVDTMQASPYFSHAASDNMQASPYFSHAASDNMQASPYFLHAASHNMQASPYILDAALDRMQALPPALNAVSDSIQTLPYASHAASNSIQTLPYASHAASNSIQTLPYASHAASDSIQALPYASHAAYVSDSMQNLLYSSDGHLLIDAPMLNRLLPESALLDPHQLSSFNQETSVDPIQRRQAWN